MFASIKDWSHVSSKCYHSVEQFPWAPDSQVSSFKELERKDLGKQRGSASRELSQWLNAEKCA
jgi:hypothetical protein